MDRKVGRAVNEVIDAMVERRSCRSFKAEMPSEEQLDAVVEAGLYAASGMGRQSAIILKVTDRTLRDRLSALNAQVMGAPEGTDPFYGAPAVLVGGPGDGPPDVYDGRPHGQHAAGRRLPGPAQHLDPPRPRGL